MADSSDTTETERAVRACRRELPERFDGAELVFGFDGVVDSVRTFVDKGRSRTEYDRIATLKAFRDRLDDSIAAESSLTVEWRTEGTRTGGHACHLSRVFDGLGADTTMIGTYGQPPREPFRSEFAGSTLVSIGAPGFCNAVEFDDGKLMLAQAGEAADLDWETLRDRIDPASLAEHLDGADLLGVGYWSMTPALPSLVSTLVSETWPLQSSPPEHVFFDTGDVRNLPRDTLCKGAIRLEETNEVVRTTVSANRSETKALAAAFDGPEPSTLTANAEQVYEGLGVTRFVGHSPSRAVTVSGGESVSIRVPRTDEPAMTTSAGDHFNAGFLLGHLAGLSNPATTVVANAAAGSFVRTGLPPDYDDVAEFVDAYLEKF